MNNQTRGFELDIFYYRAKTHPFRPERASDKSSEARESNRQVTMPIEALMCKAPGGRWKIGDGRGRWRI